MSSESACSESTRDINITVNDLFDLMIKFTKLVNKVDNIFDILKKEYIDKDTLMDTLTEEDLRMVLFVASTKDEFKRFSEEFTIAYNLQVLTLEKLTTDVILLSKEKLTYGLSSILKKILIEAECLNDNIKSTIEFNITNDIKENDKCYGMCVMLWGQDDRRFNELKKELNKKIPLIWM